MLLNYCRIHLSTTEHRSKVSIIEFIYISAFQANRLFSTVKLMPYQPCLHVYCFYNAKIEKHIATHSLHEDLQ